MTTSPLIFFGDKVLEDFHKLQALLNSMFELELNEMTAQAIEATARRKFNQMNASPNTFVSLHIVDTDHEDFGPQEVVIELYTKELPQSCKRFLELCHGRPRLT